MIPYCSFNVGMRIGFDPSTKIVREDAGNVSVCVRILQPASENESLGSVNSFRVAIRTQQNLLADGKAVAIDYTCIMIGLLSL